LHSEQRKRPAFVAFSFFEHIGQEKIFGTRRISPQPRGFEEIDRVGERILDIKELREAKKLENLVYLRLNLEKDDIPPFGLTVLRKR
jgi:hypothetical protein